MHSKMKAVLVNYNFRPTWLFDYDFDYLIYDRSDSKEYLKDFPQERIIYRPNIGNVDYDKLSYLVDNYYNLPNVFLWGKTNLFKYITKEEFDPIIKEAKCFWPLLTRNHREYADSLGQVCYYGRDGMYFERSDNWYLNVQPAIHFNSFSDWAHEFHIPSPAYTPFAPGGNYILTKETVQKYGVNLYERMMSFLPYCQLPGEAQLAERSYYLLWK